MNKAMAMQVEGSKQANLERERERKRKIVSIIEREERGMAGARVRIKGGMGVYVI